MKKIKILFFLICLVTAIGICTVIGGCGDTGSDTTNPVKVTITFRDSDAVTDGQVQNIVKGEKVQEPSKPVKEGFIFDGWFTEEGVLFDFTKPVTANVVLIAHWTPKSDVVKGYTATLKYENGTTDGSLNAAKTGDNWFFTKPENPTKTGYIFDGWFTEVGALFDFTKPVTANVVLVAHWIVEQSYTATLKYENGAADGLLTAVKTGDNWFFTKPENPTKTGYIFDNWFTEAGALFDFTKPVTANAVLVAHWTQDGFNATLIYNNGQPNGTLETVKENGNYYFNKPINPTKSYHNFVAWCTDEELAVYFNFDIQITGNITLYAKWEQAYDTVKTAWDFEACATEITQNPSGNVTVPTDTLFQGKFLLGADARFELGSVNCINTQTKTLEFTVSGESGSVYFKSKWASSSAGSFKIVNRDTEQVEYDSGRLTSGSAEFEAVVSDLVAGTYAVISTGSVRFYSFELTEKLPQGPTTGIELNTVSVEKTVLAGRTFNMHGLSVMLVYENGRRDFIALSDEKLQIEVPENFTNYAGVKTINVIYKLNNSTTYTNSFTVSVCEVDELVCFYYALDSDCKTMHVQTLFNINDKLNCDNLVVKARCLLPNEYSKSIEFILDSDEYRINKPDTSTAGDKAVGISYSLDLTKYIEYIIYVAPIPDLSQRMNITVTVDPLAQLSTVAIYNVHTLSQALEFFKLAKASDEAVKTIALKKNTVYKEKVEIDMKNIVLTTDGITDAEIAAFANGFCYDNSKDLYDSFAVIEFDALSGILDPSETVKYGVEGCAAVSVRAGAENFTAKFVTFKNHYNTNALINDALKITTDSKGVAALVQADKATFMNCKFTSYSNTLYAQIGRQYYSQCLIEGHNEYIFGYNATAYFDNCLIRSIGAGATQETNSNYNDGGYVISTKGFNQAVATDGIEYGFIFNGCEFTGDDATADGSVSVARGWGENMRVMIMNSTFSAKFSKEAYGEVTVTGKNMNDRYGKLNAAPNSEYLLEYNNTGNGAIQASLTDTCTVVNSTVVEKYGDLNTVFNSENGKVNYADSWNPVNDETPQQS